MSLLDLQIAKSATSLSVVGGTVAALTGLNSDFKNLHIAMDDGVSVKDRTVVKFSVSPEKASITGPNGYSQARSQVQIVRPITLANAAITYNTCTLSLSSDVETTEAEVVDMILSMAQILSSTDAREFFTKRAAT